MSKKEKIAILIPAYNEEKHLGKVLNDCLAYNLDVIVVDDGSQDKTSQVVKKIQKKVGKQIILIKHHLNQGKGSALKTGFQYVLENHYQGVITLDADGQHKVKEIELFLKNLKQQPVDLIVGNRLDNTQNMPFVRLATNVITSKIISVLAGQKVDDVQSGFRFISCQLLKNVELKTKNFDTEPEIILKASWLQYPIKNIPITTIYHQQFISQVNPLTDTIKFFKLIGKSFIWRYQLRSKLPKKKRH